MREDFNAEGVEVFAKGAQKNAVPCGTFANTSADSAFIKVVG
jgi:hypothetical protein